jgi:hypothetical protein
MIDPVTQFWIKILVYIPATVFRQVNGMGWDAWNAMWDTILFRRRS